MRRRVTAADPAAVADLVAATGFFDSEERQIARESAGLRTGARSKRSNACGASASRRPAPRRGFARKLSCLLDGPPASRPRSLQHHS